MIPIRCTVEHDLITSSVLYDCPHNIVCGLDPVGAELILVIREMNVDGDSSLSDDCDSQLLWVVLKVSVKFDQKSPAGRGYRLLSALQQAANFSAVSLL